MVDLSVNRLSEQADVIPLMVSERLMDVHKDLRGSTIEAVGQFRSYNRHEGVKNRLMLSVLPERFVFWMNLRITPEPTRSSWTVTYASLRSTEKPLLGREIADLLLAVNRPYGKSDYIPCISWGRNARFASGFTVGTRVRIWGRVQSREYTKSSARQSVKRGWHTRFLSASWNAARSRINKFSYDFLTENIRNICIISYIVLECVL